MDAPRLSGILLILFGALTFAAPFLPSHAAFTASSPPGDVAAFFRDDATLQTLQAWLHAAPAMLLFASVALLFPRLRDAGSRGPALAVTALVAAGAFLAITAALFLFITSAIRAAADGFDPHTALLLYDAGWAAMVFFTAFVSPFLIVPIALIAPHAGFARWMRPFGLVIGALSVAVVLAMAVPASGGAGFLGLVLLLLWSIVTGVALATNKATATPR